MIPKMENYMIQKMENYMIQKNGKLYDPKNGKLYDPKNENLYGYNHWVAEQVFARITFTTGLTNGYNHWISDGAKPSRRVRLCSNRGDSLGLHLDL